MLISFKEDQYIPVKNKIINKQQVLEKVVLADEQIDSLTSLLYNVGIKPIPGIEPVGTNYKCYEPRNGILFLNSAGKAFEYIEICFACERTRKSSNLVNEGQYCSTKYDLLKNFFLKTGIKYGTGERYPILGYKDIFKLDTMEAVFAIKNKIAKKTADGMDLNGLSDTERILFFTINAQQIYNGSYSLSGISNFYLINSGNYCKQTLIALKDIGANRTLKTLEQADLQWPDGKIPDDISERRALLITIINNADPKWRKLEEELFDYVDEVGARILTAKENLTGLIFEFANSHRNELND